MAIMERTPEEREFDDESLNEEDDNLPQTVSVAEPLALWLMLLVLAVIVKLAMMYSTAFSSTSLASLLNTLATSALGLPGAVVLPIIVGALVGIRVGDAVKGRKDVFAKGLINSVYVAIVYLLSIVIIYVLLEYAVPGAAPSFAFFTTEWLLLPVVIEIILVMLFSILTYARR